MASGGRDVDMSNYHYSSSPELSSPPSNTPSEPGSPSRHDQGRTGLVGHHPDEIVVDVATAPRFSLMQQTSQQPALLQPFSLDGVRLTKDGIPRKKPGRKPGPVVKKAGDGTSVSASSATAAGSGVEATKLRRPRKSKDASDSGPPANKRKRISQASDVSADIGIGATVSAIPRATSADLRLQPKTELTSMRMDIDPRRSAPAAASLSHPVSGQTQPPRQPPLSLVDKMPKREAIPSSMMSILNADDDVPLRPPHAATSASASTRSYGQSYDPVRSSTYDPVRETMLSRDPYGTGPLGSPRAPLQITSRSSASASPSIASLVDPAPVALTRSPVATSSISRQVSPPLYSSTSSNAATVGSSSQAQPSLYLEHAPPSLPPSPSPSPAIRNMVSSSASHLQSSMKKPTSTSSSSSTSQAPPMRPSPLPTNIPQPAATSAATSRSSLSASSTSSPPTATALKSTSARGDASGQKPHSRAAPLPASAKSTTSKSVSAKSAPQKGTSAKAAAAAAAAAAASSSEKPEKSEKSSHKNLEKASEKASDKAASSKLFGPATTSFKDVAMTGMGNGTASAATSTTPLIKKFSSILHQERGGKQSKALKSATSSPKLTSLKDDAALQPMILDPPVNGSSHGNSHSNGTSTSNGGVVGGDGERSILDFGKARPGEEHEVPSIVLHVPLVSGENNKYVNFMRMAEERYGWDALHPRLAAHRDRKLRIAAASAALERNGSGRESGDEMTDDMQSGDEGSNDDNAGTGENGTNAVNTSGPEDLPAKPVRKKRVMKEDEYDKDDDFVDDSELLWEEQAAASRDGFFVYSGPLVPEVEAPVAEKTPPTKRGRGSRGGRGGAARTTAARSSAARGAGGAGARTSTTARKPRITKQEKEQREREKADHERATSKSTNNFSLTSPPLAMAVDA